jgi:glycosyltransferase involved in cell wall biosynthesis
MSIYISIVTPLYNKAPFISETISSIKSQLYKDWEWVIVDDGSTDGSELIAERASKEDYRIKYISKRNEGPCSARNLGIIKSSGEWLLFLDADDTIDDDYLFKLVHLSNNSKYNIHATGWYEVDYKSQKIVNKHDPIGLHALNPMIELHNTAIAYAPWHPTSALVRKEAVLNDCFWDQKMNRMVTEDTVFWWKLIATNTVSVHSLYGVRYRRGTPNCRDQYLDIAKWSNGVFYALHSNVEYWQKLGYKLNETQISNLVRVYERIGIQAMQLKNFDISDEAFFKCDALLKNLIWRSPGVILRKKIGSKNFAKIRNAINI